MKFGILYIPDYNPDLYKSASHYYGEMMEQIQCDEELGFEVNFGGLPHKESLKPLEKFAKYVMPQFK